MQVCIFLCESAALSLSNLIQPNGVWNWLLPFDKIKPLEIILLFKLFNITLSTIKSTLDHQILLTHEPWPLGGKGCRSESWWASFIFACLLIYLIWIKVLICVNNIWLFWRFKLLSVCKFFIFQFYWPDSIATLLELCGNQLDLM